MNFRARFCPRDARALEMWQRAERALDFRWAGRQKRARAIVEEMQLIFPCFENSTM